MRRLLFTSFNRVNRRLILLLIVSHLLWSCALFGLWSAGSLFESPHSFWSAAFIAFQLFGAAQLLLPALLLLPEQRSRGFYLFWAGFFLLSIWLANQLTPAGIGQPLLTVIKSALLLLAATVAGAAMARYVNRLWEIVPVCIVMTLADFSSWLYGPTASFSREIEQFYRSPTGPPPLIDMILVKLVFPGQLGLAPAFGVSDWIMVVFFAMVARRYQVNDNLIGPSGALLARQGRIGRYLPVSVLALFIATTLAQTSGLFIPALPVIAVIMLFWYALRYLLTRIRLAG